MPLYKSDGIPNIRSNDDVFIIKGSRQSPITQKKLDVWVHQSPKDFCDKKMLRNWNRNKQVIDLDNVPQNIQNEVLDKLRVPVLKDKGDMLKYFIGKDLNNLIGAIGDF